MKIPGTNDIPAETVTEWEKLFADDMNRPGMNIYENIFSNSYLMPLQRKAEVQKMLRLVRSIQPKIIMEIGSDKGGSVYHWCKAFTPAAMIAIEYRGVPWADAFRKAFPYTRFLCIEGSSYEAGTIAAVRDFLGSYPIDCVFIDGDKNAFSKDVAAYLPMVRKGGLVLLHDVQNVRNAQETMANWGRNHRTETIMDFSEYPAILENENAGRPPADGYEAWYRIWRESSCGVGVIHV